MTDTNTSEIISDEKIHISNNVTPQGHSSSSIDIDEITGDKKRMAELHNNVRRALFPVDDKEDKQKGSAKHAVLDDNSDSDLDFVKPRTNKIAKTNDHNRHNSRSGAGKWSLKLFAERLQGQLVLITARYRGKNMSDYDNYGYIFHAVKACDNDEFEIFQKFHVTDICLSASPNSDEQLEGEEGYFCYALIMFVPKETTDKTIYNFVDDLAIWMCHHHWSALDSCVVHGRKFGNWRVDPNDWDETRSPQRKLGQVATISSACRALTGFDDNLFSHKFYETRPKLANKYFDHPYSSHLHWCFGFPVEEN
jgi:hypothetical protein